MISLDLSYRGQEAQKANPHRGAFGAKCPVAPRSSAASSTISRAPPPSSSSLTRSSSSSSTTRSSPPRSSTRPPSPSPVAVAAPQPQPSPAKAVPRSRSPSSNSSLRRSTGGPYIPSSLAPDSIYDTDEDEDGMAPYKLPPSVDPLIALSLAPYDTCDPEIAQYCTLPTPPNSLPRSSPFSRSNSPLPVNGDLFSSLPSVQDSIVAPPVLKTPAIAAAFVDFEAYGRQALFDFNQKALRTTQIISDFTGSPESQSMSRENRARLTFLKDTVDLFVTYLGRQAQATAQIRAYVSLLDAAAEQMDQTFLMISKILGGETVMTPNFDIFELTLRRYQEQLARMFPAGDAQQVVARPSMLIQDARTKTIWEEAFGPSCWFVSFATFIAEIVDKQFLSRAPESLNRDTFVLFLRYFLNFPVDDMVTTYKWNALMQLFGPPDSFLSNFSAYGLGQGFLGLTNRINAYEILSVKPESRIVLIRLSRTEPEFLAFSYKNSRGEIGHQVNKGPDGRAIPIKRFLEHKFPGYALVSERLDIASILGKSLDSTLCDYANASQDYIL